jgi:hypothetical protein
VSPGAKLCACPVGVVKTVDLEADTVSLLNATRKAVNVTLPNLGISVVVYRSKIDGQTVVHIDTEEDRFPCDSAGPTGLLVYLNDDTDDPIWGSHKEESDD